MGRVSRTEEEIVEELLAKAIPSGDCLECHLRPSIDRANRERQYVQVGGRLGKKWGVPRLVLHIKKGPLAPELWALHSCDNPKCINPDHLFAGTAQDNTDDMISKGRKVDDPNVGLRRRLQTSSRIKRLQAEGLTNDQICNRLCISKSTLWNYRNGPYRGSISFPSRDTD